MANYPYKRPGTQLDEFRETLIEFQIAVEQDVRGVVEKNNSDIAGVKDVISERYFDLLDKTVVLKEQMDNLIIKGDSGPQAAAASIDINGKEYKTLKDRIDAEQQKLIEQYNVLSNQIGTIITTPAEGITEQEIIDARQGTASLGQNISNIKNRLGLLNAYFYNYIVNGDFKEIAGWDSRNSTNTISNNTIMNTGNGAGTIPYLRQVTAIKLDTIKKMYLRAKVRVTNSGATTIRVGFLNAANAWVGDPLQIDMPTKDKWFDVSHMITTKEKDSGNLTLAIQHTYRSAAEASGQTLEVKDVVLLNLTEIYGPGEEMNDASKLLDSLPNNFFDGQLTPYFTQKMVLDYLLNNIGIFDKVVNEAKEYTDEKTQNIEIVDKNIPIPPIDLMDYEREYWETFEDGIWAQSYAGQLSTETEIVRFGTKAMKMFKTDQTAIARKSLETPIDLSKKMIVLSLYIQDTSIFNTMKISFRTGGTNWTNVMMFDYNNDFNLKRNLHTGWNYLIVEPANLLVSGTATLADMDKVNGVQISLGEANPQGTTIIIDSIFLVDKPKMEAPIITITFDDGFQSDYTIARPYMSKYGFLGTSYVVPSMLSTHRYMSENQLRIMYEMGWDISNHTMRHLMMKDNMTAENWIKDMNEGYQWLMDKGFKRSAAHLAYPGGYNTPATLKAVGQYHKSARVNLGTSQTIPANHLHQLKAYNGAAPLENVKTRIDIALSKGQWLILMFHEINDAVGMDGTACTEAHFKAIIDYLHQKQAKVLPMSQVVK